MAKLDADAPAVLAIALELLEDSGRDFRLGDDPRRAVLHRIALAWTGTEGTRAVVVFERSILGACAAALGDRWSRTDPKPPYVIFEDAHLAGAVLRRSAPLPSRIGCCNVAATLLDDGGPGGADRPLEERVRATLGHALRPMPPMDDGGVQVAQRADVLESLLRSYTPRLRKLGCTPSYELECNLIPEVVAMEAAGMAVDRSALEALAREWSEERARPDLPENRRARLDKLLSTYASWPALVDADGRLRCRLHPLATDSGRFSCTDPNLQQVPSEHTAPGMRTAFRPPSDRALVVADYAQIELRVAAALAPCDALKRVFMEGGDPHRRTAATLTGKPEAEIDTQQRKLAKAINFGFLFGMGAPRFRQYAQSSYGIDLSEDDARRAREAFFATFPGIAAWHRRTGAMQPPRHAPAPVTVRTLLGRRKTFPPDGFSFNAALNIPVQGTAAEGFKRAMTLLGPRLREMGGLGVLCVHDEYIAEVPREVAESAREAVTEVMRTAMASVVEDVPIVVEASIVDSWGEAK